MRSIILFLALIAFASPSLAGPNPTGAWHANGYRIEADGKRYPCEDGPCLKAHPQVCVPTNVLRPYTEARLGLIARMLKFQFHDCKETVATDVHTHDRKMQCAEGVLTQHLEQPDATHLRYSSIVESPRLGRMEVGTAYEFINDDCDGIADVIRPTVEGARK